MQVLALTPRLPFPPHGGDRVRAFELLTRLAKRHPVTLLSFIENAAQQSDVEELRRRCPKLAVETVLLSPLHSRLSTALGLFSRRPLQLHYYRSRVMRARVAALLADGRIDAVYVQMLRMAPYVETRRDLRRVLDSTDAVSMVLQRAQALRPLWMRIPNWVETRRIARYEREAVAVFDQTTLVAEPDVAHLEAGGAPRARLAIVRNGVDREYFAPRAARFEPQRIAFVGNMFAFPNQDAAFWIARELLPRLRAELPDASADLVGIHPPAALLRLGDRDGLRVTGAVPDVRPYVENAALSLCPMRIAAGIQNKILESLALGVPVVTTPEGFEGLGARGEADGVRVGANAAELVGQCAEILRDPSLRAALGARGRAFIERAYDWEKEVDQLEKLLAGRL